MYTYAYHAKRETWVVYWNGSELRRRFYLCEAAARAYCEAQNRPQKDSHDHQSPPHPVRSVRRAAP